MTERTTVLRVPKALYVAIVTRVGRARGQIIGTNTSKAELKDEANSQSWDRDDYVIKRYLPEDDD